MLQVTMLLVVCKLSSDVFGYEDSLRMFIANWSISICLVVEQSFIFSQMVGYNQSLFCRGQFCLSPSISIFYGTSNC